MNRVIKFTKGETIRQKLVKILKALHSIHFTNITYRWHYMFLSFQNCCHGQILCQYILSENFKTNTFSLSFHRAVNYLKYSDVSTNNSYRPVFNENTKHVGQKRRKKDNTNYTR